jgi:hypothetical protein
MKKRDIETVLDIPFATLKALAPLHVFVYVGKKVEKLGTTKTVTRALELIHSKAFFYDEEEEEEERPDGITEAQYKALKAITDPTLKELISAFRASMDRVTSEKKLHYLAEVPKKHGLRVVIAWEAAAPLHDIAYGIFTAAKG